MEEKRKKLLFVFVFSTYLPMILLKFWSRELIGCGIWFFMQRVPTVHTFDRSLYPEKNKYLKKHDDDVIIMFFRYFSKVNSVSTRWMQNLILHPMSSPDQNLSKNMWRYVKNTNKKVVFFISSSKINKYYFISLLIFLGSLFWVEISSNVW